LFLLFVVLCGAGTYYAFQKYYPLPPFAASLPGHNVPSFAYDHTPPESFAPDLEPALPGHSLRDQLALTNIADTMKKVKIQDTAVDKTSAMLAEGEKYLYGRGVITNCDLARKSFEDAAKIGNSAAMAHLGSMYGAGRCVQFNRVKAYEWFAKAKNADPNNTWVESSMDMLWRNMSRTERAAILK
jgi:TPR repeat protein